jgi:hypothetical protein
MSDLGWTEPSFFLAEDDQVALQHAITRYHAYGQTEFTFTTALVDKLDGSFLDLMASSPASFFVPTLDIDLAWHTHQLMAKDYRSACIVHTGRVIDQ